MRFIRTPFFLIMSFAFIVPTLFQGNESKNLLLNQVSADAITDSDGSGVYTYSGDGVEGGGCEGEGEGEGCEGEGA